MNYQLFTKRNFKSISDLNVKAIYISKMERPKIGTFTRKFLGISDQLVLPAKLSSYEYSIENGLGQQTKTRSFGANIALFTIVVFFALFWLLTPSNVSHALLFDNNQTLAKTTSVIHKTTDISKVIKTISLPELDESVLEVPTLASITEHSVLQQPQPWLNVTIHSGDTLSSLFKEHGLSRTDLHQILKIKPYDKTLRTLYPNQEISIKHQKETIEEIRLGIDFSNELRVYKDNDTFKAAIQARNITTHTKIAYGKVESSLFAAGQKAGISDQLIANMLDIFRWDVDFRPFRRGDKFSMVYELHRFKSKEKAGDILAVEIINDGKVYQAVRYTNPEGKTDYYKPNGELLFKKIIEVEKKTEAGTLLVPVKNARISSKYGMRKHPIFGTMRFHSGVDYAAVHGTEIMSIADGIVKFVGWKGGYGRTVVISHGDDYSSLYAHMSKYPENFKVGQEVKKGDVIGYVGRSGYATGNHLHYEFLFKGETQDPLMAKLPDTTIKVAKEIKEENDKTHFTEHTEKVLAQLDTARRQVLAGETPIVTSQLAKIAGVSK